MIETLKNSLLLGNEVTNLTLVANNSFYAVDMSLKIYNYFKSIKTAF